MRGAFCAAMQPAAGRARAPRSTPKPAHYREPALDLGAMQSLQSAFGVFALLGIGWIVSEDRRGVAWTQAAGALLVTFATAVLLLKVPPVARAFGAINNAVDAVSAASKAGTSFVFGYLGGGQLPFELKVPGAEFVLALQALPIVLVMSVLTTLLFYWASCRRSCAASRGRSNARSRSAARWDSRPRRTSFSAWL